MLESTQGPSGTRNNVLTIPHILLKIIRLFEQPDIDFSTLAATIRQDPVITARIIKLANNVYFRQWSEVSQLKQLLVVLGLDTVRHLTLLCATEQIFAEADPQLSRPVAVMWYRSIFCAQLCEELAALVGHEPKEEAYLTGLLHRIGQLALVSCRQGTYVERIDITNDLEQIEPIEQQHFKTTSSIRATEELTSYALNAFMCDAVAFQTIAVEQLADATIQVRLLALARRLCDQQMDEIALARAANLLLGLNADVVRDLRQRVKEKTDALICNLTCIETDDIPDAAERLMSSHDHFHQLLRQQVQAHSLANVLNGGLAPDNEQTVFARLRRDFHLLFGLDQLCLLVAKDGYLQGFDDLGQTPLLNNVTVQLDNPTSLAVNTYHRGDLHCSCGLAQHTLSIADRQLHHLMNAETLCYIPLPNRIEPSHIAVARIRTDQWQKLQDRKSLLLMAALSIGQSLEQAMASKQLAEHQQQMEAGQHHLQLRSAAHEINNPLSIINNYLFLLGQKLQQDPEAAAQLTIIQEEMARVGTMVSGLKHLLDPQQSEDHPVNEVDLNRVIEKLLLLLTHSLFTPRQLSVHLDLDQTVPLLQGNVGSIKQILVNLLKNAAEALPPGGEVWLTTRDSLHKNGQRYIEIDLRDNGPGLPDAILNQLFQPTISHKQGHSGLGLSIVKKLVDQLQGEISYTSCAKGTRFQLLLPRIESERSEHSHA
nr:HDOD domain-containing protein [uncultured Desulfuromonas sp.]